MDLCSSLKDLRKNNEKNKNVLLELKHPYGGIFVLLRHDTINLLFDDLYTLYNYRVYYDEDQWLSDKIVDTTKNIEDCLTVITEAFKELMPKL